MGVTAMCLFNNIKVKMDRAWLTKLNSIWRMSCHTNI